MTGTRSLIMAALGALALLAGAGTARAAPPPPPSGPLKDWPCAPLPETAALTPEALYGKPLPAPLPSADAWRADPEVKTLVNFAAGSENTAGAGVQQIELFAASAGPRKRERLLLAFSGIVERIEALRAVLIEGVGHQVVNSRLVAAEIARNDQDIQTLAGDGTPAAVKRRQDVEQARFWNRRSLGDVWDKADFTCRQLDHAGKKAAALAAAIRLAIEGP